MITALHRHQDLFLRIGNLTKFTQVFALGFLLFTSATTGLAVGIAFIRGLTGRSLGNFYQDLTQSIIRILLPISFVGALFLIAAGIPETWSGVAQVTTLEGTTQAMARGPVAHFEIIKQLGENGVDSLESIQLFIDRMIALVKGSERSKTPNEIALTVFLVR